MARYSRPFKIDPSRYISVFTDASFCPDTKAWGYGWWIKYGSPAITRTGSGGGLGIVNSNEAEIGAIKAALQWVEDNLKGPDTLNKVLVLQSDCTGALNCVQPDLNKLAIKCLMQRAYSKHVKGHRGHETPRNSVNTTCDRLAREQMEMYRAHVRSGSAKLI